MKIHYFTHSLLSCWNHGNAHFLRGVLRELADLGHDVLAVEPQGSWSLSNLLADHGEAGLSAFHAAYPELKTFTYGAHSELDALVDA
ncbi:MAG TPA: glycosyltransferase, partial [Sphingobium sp.]|nr:glycosyltransferase [Sphingobium sp.]